jgi:hypothetical protein
MNVHKPRQASPAIAQGGQAAQYAPKGGTQ